MPGRVLNHISANDVDGAAGHHHLHAVAQRAGPARGRPHRHQARRRAVLRRRHRHHAPPRRDLDEAPHPRRCARLRHRRDLGLLPAQRAGPAVARAAADADQRRPVERGLPVPRGARDRHRLSRASLCIRITYVGELGYELYIPTEQAVHVYERLVEAGKGFGLRHAGLKALASLRMEKGYRDYGHDIDNTDNAFETGLGLVRRPRRSRAASSAARRC